MIGNVVFGVCFVRLPTVQSAGLTGARFRYIQLDQHLIPFVSRLVFPGEVVQDNVQGIPQC